MPTSGEAVRANLEGVDLAVPNISGTSFRQAQERQRRTADIAFRGAQPPAAVAIPMEGDNLVAAGFGLDQIFEGVGDWWEDITQAGAQRRAEMEAGGGQLEMGMPPLLGPAGAAGAGVTAAQWANRLAALGLIGGGIADILNPDVGWFRGGNGGRQMSPGDVPLVGPGLKEPPAAMVMREWNNGGNGMPATAQYYQLTNGWIYVYSKKSGAWSKYKPAKNIVITKNPRMGSLVKAQKQMDRLWKGIEKRMPKRKVKTVYGQVPSRLLSPAEKQLVKS